MPAYCRHASGDALIWNAAAIIASSSSERQTAENNDVIASCCILKQMQAQNERHNVINNAFPTPI